LPRALTLNSALATRVAAVAAADVLVDAKAAASAFITLKVARTVADFVGLTAALGVNSTDQVRILVVKRFYTLVTDEFPVEITTIIDISFVLVGQAIGNPNLDLYFNYTAANGTNSTLQSRLSAFLQRLLHTYCNPYSIVEDLSITSVVRLSIWPVPKKIPSDFDKTDDIDGTATADFVSNVTIAIASQTYLTDADYTSTITASNTLIGGIVTTINNQLTTATNLVVQLSVNFTAFVQATATIFATVDVDAVVALTVNITTEQFLAANIAVRAKLAAAQTKIVLLSLIDDVQRDIAELKVYYQTILRFEATINQQLAAALQDKFALLLSLNLCPASSYNAIDVTTEFTDDQAAVLAAVSADCAVYANIYARINSLKRQLAVIVLCKRAHVTLVADVQVKVDYVTGRYIDFGAKIDAAVTASANFTIKKTDAELAATWNGNATVVADFKARVENCLAILGSGSFGAEISLDIQIAVDGTFQHVVTCTNVDFSVTIQADLEVRLAALLPICIVQCTGGDASYFSGKAVGSGGKRQASSGTIAASQPTTTQSSSSTSSTSSTGSASQSSSSTGATNSGPQSSSSTGGVASSTNAAGSDAGQIVFSALLVSVAVAASLLV